jgi:hypothetical protein
MKQNGRLVGNHTPFQDLLIIGVGPANPVKEKGVEGIRLSSHTRYFHCGCCRRSRPASHTDRTFPCGAHYLALHVVGPECKAGPTKRLKKTNRWHTKCLDLNYRHKEALLKQMYLMQHGPESPSLECVLPFRYSPLKGSYRIGVKLRWINTPNRSPCPSRIGLQ